MVRNTGPFAWLWKNKVAPKALPAAGEARRRRRYFQRGLIENPIASWVFSATDEEDLSPFATAKMNRDPSKAL